MILEDISVAGREMGHHGRFDPPIESCDHVKQTGFGSTDIPGRNLVKKNLYSILGCL